MDNINFFEEKPLDQVTIGELAGMVVALSAKRKEYEEKKKIASLVNDEVEIIEQKILSILENQNLTKFNVDGIGTVYTSDKFQVSFPKDPDKADALRAYCYEHGLASMLTMNHNSLNSLYKSKKEELELAGELDFSNVLAGVDEPKVYKTIGFRKG
jgi:hypothetical protein